MSSSCSVDMTGTFLMFSLEMPSYCAKLLSIYVEPFIPVLPTTFSPTWLIQRPQQLLDLIFRCMRCECSILESSFVDQLDPVDLLALQADWVDEYCPEEEGLGENKREEKHEKSVEDEEMGLKRLPSSPMYSHLDDSEVLL